MDSSPRVYLDNAATTPLDPVVLEAMMPFLTQEFGNAASPHAFGQRASAAVEDARSLIAALVGGESQEIIFTSGATESINLALKGVLASAPHGKGHFITAATEHKAVLDTTRALERAGARVTILPVDHQGVVSVGDLDAAISSDTWLVSLMAANNETGTLGPIRELAARTHEAGALFHTDATQMVGKLPIDVDELGIDLMSFSSHKLYGPKGVGALYVRRTYQSAVSPQMHGGGHERGLRSGTINVPGCVGFGHACATAVASLAQEADAVGKLRTRLEHMLLSNVQGVSVNGHPYDRLPNIVNVRFSGVDADSLMLSMPEVAVSSGSACTSATPTPSHVLRAMGLDYQAAGECIRFSLGRFTTMHEIDLAVQRVADAVLLLRQTSIQRVQEAVG